MDKITPHGIKLGLWDMFAVREVLMVQDAVKRFDTICADAREEVFAKVMRHYQKNPNSPWSGAPLRDLENTIRVFYASLGLEIKEEFKNTLPPVMRECYDRAVAEMRKSGLRNAILGTPDSGRIKYFLTSTYEQVAMYTDKMSFANIRDLRRIASAVANEMSVTGMTRREVSKKMLDRALKIHGFEFIDRSGTKWPLKSYFETLARTEFMNAGRASYDDKMAEEGFDVMRLTYSGGSCEKCARFEGRLFSLTGATSGLPTKEELEAAGVFHPNCTHSYSLVPDFVRERDYNTDGTRKR